MQNSVLLAQFITLGQQVYILRNPLLAKTVLDEIPKFMRSLKNCGLTRTSAAAEVLNSISDIQRDPRNGLVTEQASRQLQAYMVPITDILYDELGWQCAVVVQPGSASKELSGLANRLPLNDTQRNLLDETMRCVESGAYRAGVVLAWNLAYDFIRQWVFNNHLSTFNAALTSGYVRRNGTPLFDPIACYTDFFTGKPDERTVIDVCHTAGIIGEKLRDNLRFYLRRRNDYAHPSFKTPSAEQTSGYIRDLVDTITGRPFV